MTQAEIDDGHRTPRSAGDSVRPASWISGKKRVSGPFSVEAVPAPTVKPIDTVVDNDPHAADNTVARTGETLRQSNWRDELLKTGIRGKAGQYVKFARLEPLPGAPGLRNLHADGETLPNELGANYIREGGAASVSPSA